MSLALGCGVLNIRAERRREWFSLLSWGRRQEEDSLGRAWPWLCLAPSAPPLSEQEVGMRHPWTSAHRHIHTSG